MKSTIYSDHHFSIFDYASKFLGSDYSFKKVKNKKNSLAYKGCVDKVEDNSIVKSIYEKEESSLYPQQEFMNSIIHELKNPISAIMGLTQILRNEKDYDISEFERMDYLKMLDETAGDLNELVHDLLDVGEGAISKGFSIDLSKEMNVKEVIQRSINISKDYGMRRGVSINFEVEEDVCSIKLDIKRMKQILSNIISNAIKYSSKDTTVRVSARNVVSSNNSKHLEIIISDQGFGMTQEEVATAFQKYQTIKNPNSNKVDSFGLGLPIVKQLVESQNGMIFVESEPNKGTDFILKFPYKM